MKPPTRLAIIGYGCRLPGGVDDGPSFWRLLSEGRDAVREVPADRWNIKAVFNERPGVAGKSASRWGGFLDQIDQFEPECFGISPREAAFIDPQQRLLLETAWEALEDAAIPINALTGSRTGVFIGISTGDYSRLQALPLDMRQLTAFTAQGTSFSIAANRLSYCFDLRGPSIVVDTACSSSLVALDCAAKSLCTGESDLALVGGANALITPEVFVSFSAASMLSPEGRCKAFDASAHGFVRAEGAGVVVLKRLDDALRDRDRIHAVVLATAVNQDGRTSGMAMPNVEAQAALLRDVYDQVGIRPADVPYVEAHGTGTAIGDPTEARALGEVFGQNRPAETPLTIGSVKTNIGHLEAAAGMASLLKVVLMLEKRQVPASLHFTTPNPHIAFDTLRLRVPTALESWRDEAPAIAGINSFGFGGTNAHAIVGEFRGNGHRPAAVATRAWPLVLTARTLDALKLHVEAWLTFLGDAEADGIALSDVAATAAVRRTHGSHRLGFAAASYEEARQHLQAFAGGESRNGVHYDECRHERPKLAFVFCGQGSQSYGMGRQLLEAERVFRETIERCDAIFEPVAGWSLMEEMRCDEPTSRMDHTAVAQPMIFALQVGLAELWKSWGVTPSAVVGHSVGELAAAYVAGALSLESAVRLIAHRGRCLEDAALPGRMLAVALSEPDARSLIQDAGVQVCVSAVNSPEMLTLGGEAPAIERIAAQLAQRGVWFRPLQVGHAFHTPLVEPAREPFLRAFDAVITGPLQCGMVSTVTGQDVNGQPLDRDYWWRNIRQPVRFGEAITRLRQQGVELFLEVGAHPVLASAIKQCRPTGAPPSRVWPSMERGRGEQQTMTSTLAALFTIGVSVNWGALWPPPVAPVDLPRHPWLRQRYWSECEASRRLRLDSDYHPLLGHPVAGRDRRWQFSLDARGLPWLNDHRIGGRTLVPAAAFVEMTLAAAMRTLGTSACTLDDVSIERALFVPEAAAVDVQVSVNPDSMAVTICSRITETDDGWMQHVEATCRAASADGDAERLDVDAWRQRADAHVPGDDLYDAYRAVGMEFGPAFRGVREVMRRDGLALGRVELPETGTADQAYGIHPALLDACFHVLLETLPPDSRGSGSMYLPERIDRVRALTPVGSSAWSEVRLRAASQTFITGDIRIFNPTGELALEISGFRCKALPRSADRSVQSLNGSFYRIEWQHQPLPLLPVVRPPLAIRGGVQRLVRAADAKARQIWHDRSPRDTEEGLRITDRQAVAHILQTVRQFGKRIDIRALVQAGVLVERFRPQFECCMGALVDAGYAKSTRTGWRLIDNARPETVSEIWQEALARHPGGYAPVRLIDICGTQLGAIWSGKLDPLEVLFSREGMDLLEQMYRDEEWTRYANAFIRQVIVEVVSTQPQHRPLRILEVGAGTGGTTSAVLPSLPSERTEYCFTDTSPFFLARAAERFRQFESVKYQRLDIDHDFGEQGIEPGSCDVVIAADVLHASRDVRGAISRCRTALVEGGLLIARELSHSRPAFHIMFALTEGWWSYRDDVARPHGPLLTPAEWSSLLRQQGFGRPAVPACAEQATFATVFVARRPQQPAITVSRDPLAAVDGVPQEHNWLVFADKNGHSREIASKLRAHKLRCLEISAGESFAPVGADCYRADLRRDRELLADLCRREFSGPYSVVYMASLDGAGEDSSKADASHPAQTCAGVIDVLQAFGVSAAAAPRRLFVVTQRVQRVDSTSPAALSSAALTGLLRVVGNEFGAIGVRAVDLDAEDSRRFERLYGEIVAASPEEQVAWRAGNRFVPRLVRAAGGSEGSRTARAGQSESFELAFTRTGDLDSLELRQTRLGRPGSTDIEVDVHFTALNFRDLLKALGRYPADNPRQLQLGDECAGVVRAVGRRVRDLKVGDRVLICQPGVFHSRLIVPAVAAVRIPDGLSLHAAVSMPVAFLTADYALRHVGRIAAGDTVLIHSAAGGVGMAAVQIARRAGARIFATAGSPAKRELLRQLGVERVMSSRSLEFCDEVMHATGGRGVDLVLNSLAGQAMVRSLACLAPNGRFLELGKRDLYENTQVGLWPFRRNVSYHAIDLGAGDVGGANLQSTGRAALRTLIDLADKGELPPLPIRVMPVAQASEAFRLMSQGAHVGKIVLDMTQHGGAISAAPAPVRMRSDGTYLVTGAFGGVGLTVVRWLAARGARHLALMSRHGPQTDAAHSTLEELRRAGVSVRSIAGDVTDRDQVSDAISIVGTEMPPLAGVFHLASVIDDAIILNLDAERVRRSMAPKVAGAWHLHVLTRHHPLDHFVLFSSLSATVGGYGQASYAAANAALERLAAWRHEAGLPATAIGWGALGEAGYVAERPQLAEALSQSGYSFLSSQEVGEALDIALQTDEVAPVVARLDWTQFARKFGVRERTNLVSRMISSAENVPDPARVARRGEAIACAKPEDRPALIAEYVRSAAARVLGMAPEKISDDRPLVEYGLDSLMGVELASQIESGIDVVFPMNGLGQDVTIATIARVLSKGMGGSPSAVADTPSLVQSALDGCVVPLAGAPNGRPLFCFHPAGGELNVYRNIAESLSNKCRVLGIQSRVMAGAAEEFGSLAQMATAYADLVRRHDPDGPYHLFGFSFGGLLALHTARVLQEQGAPVAWVGMAETDGRWRSDGEHAATLGSFLLQLYDHMRRELQLVKEVPVEALRRDTAAAAEALLSVPAAEATGVLRDWLSRNEYLRDEAPRALVEQYLARVVTHLRLLPRASSFPAVNVPLYVWQATEGLAGDPAAWSGVSQQPVVVRTLTGGHFDVMAPPHSQSLAGELAALLTDDASYPYRAIT